MRSQEKTRREFIDAMHHEGMPEEVTRKVMRDATTLQRYGINDCNINGWRGPDHVWSPGACACRACKREREAEARIRERVTAYGIKPLFDGDPRGAVVKLVVPSGRSNNMGGVGMAVPAYVREEN